MADAKLPNIRPTIKIAIVSFNFLETIKIKIKTKKLPNADEIIIPKGDISIEVANAGKNCAPKIKNATPKLDPELKPKT